MDLEVDKTFKNIVDELKRGNRPRLKLTPQQISLYTDYWRDALTREEAQKKELLTPLLGILDHAINSDQELSQLFVQSLKDINDPELLVYLLSGASKHIIEERHKRGERVDHDFLSALEHTLTNKHPEVLEWTLRCIEQLGSQSIFFKKQVIANKPGFFKRFNKHHQAAYELIGYLEKRWSPAR